MQRHAEAEALAALAARILHGIDIGPGLARGFEHAGADLADIALVLGDREHRQQSVAHEFQDLSAVLTYRRHLAIEILIEDVDHDLGRQTVRQRGEPAQIRQPDRRLHGFGMAAADLSGHDPLAGAVADIGIKQRGRGAAQRQNLAEPCKGSHDRPQRGYLLVGETVGMLGGPARCMRGAVGEQKRQRDVVGDTFGAHVVEEGKAPARGIVQPVSDFLSAAVENRQWALMNSGVSGRSKSAVLTTTSAPGRQMKLRPRASGCSVRTKAADAPQRQRRPQPGARRSPLAARPALAPTARRRSAIR